MGSKELIKILEANGFHLVKGRGAGSHRVFKKGEITIPPVPHPKKDLPLGTVRQKWLKRTPKCKGYF